MKTGLINLSHKWRAAKPKRIRAFVICSAILCLAFSTVAHAQSDSPAVKSHKQNIEGPRIEIENGYSFLKRKEYEKAIGAFYRALELSGKNNSDVIAHAHHGVSLALRIQGVSPRAAYNHALKATEHIAQQVETSSKNKAAMFVNFGNAALACWRYDIARDAFLEASKEIYGPHLNAAFIGQAQTQLILGHPRKSLKILENVKGNDAESLKAQAYLSLRNWRKALEVLNAVSMQEPNNLVLSARAQIQKGDLWKAEEALSRAQKMIDSENDLESPILASIMYNWSEIFFLQGRFIEAMNANTMARQEYESYYGRSRNSCALDRMHHVVGLTELRQALIEFEIGNYNESAKKFEKAINTLRATLNEDNYLVIAAKVEQSRLITAQYEIGENETLDPKGYALVSLRRIRGNIGSAGESYGALLYETAMGLALFDVGRHNQARKRLEKVLKIRTDLYFPELEAVPALLAMGWIMLRDGDIATAHYYAKEAWRIHKQSGLISVDRIGESQRLLAEVEALKGEAEIAIEHAKSNVDRILSRLEELSQYSTTHAEFEPRASKAQIEQYIRLLMASNSAPDRSIMEKVFWALQIVHATETSIAVSRINLKTRDASQVSDSSIAKTGGFPKPINLEAAQKELEPFEALWLQAAFENSSYSFIVTNDSVDLHRAEIGRIDLVRSILKLRKSLNLKQSVVNNDSDIAIRSIDFVQADFLYKHLFPWSEYFAKGSSVKRVVIAADSVLQNLPFSILVRRDSSFDNTYGAGHSKFRYFGLTQSLVIVPSASSFVALRKSQTKRSVKQYVFLGIGNPNLKAKSQAEVEQAQFVVSPTSSLVSAETGLAVPAKIHELFNPISGAQRELEDVELLMPLGKTKILSGNFATETSIKENSALSAELLMFSTHATLGSEGHPPALVLTPPKVASDVDDGLLFSSEISRLSVDASLVILSACDTGSHSGRYGAAGLSGLVRSFFSAGATSLLVTHWPIETKDSEVLVPGLVDLLIEKKKMRPSEALRQYMRYIANHPTEKSLHHPARWAPFFVAGGDNWVF